MNRIAKLLGALAAASLLTLPAVAETSAAPTVDSREAETLTQSLTVLRDLQAIADQRIPDLLLSKAEGLIILPGNVKVGLWFGARFGNGVMLVRNEDRSWSNPVFVSMGGGSFGAQFGGQVSDIVLVLTTRDSIEGITDGKLTLGADASAAAGPVGRTASASTSVAFDAEVYSYAKSQGLFLGVSLEGNGIFIAKKANQRFHGTSSAAEILGNRSPAPAPAPELVAEVTKLTSSANAAVVEKEAAPPAQPAAAPAEAKTYPLPDPEPGKEPSGN
jgi:lipid-binding SYLF domain-containing protein